MRIRPAAAGAGVVVLTLAAGPVNAQQSLPTIEVGGARHRNISGKPSTGPRSARVAPTVTTGPAVAPAPVGAVQASGPLTQPKAPDTASSVRAFTGAQVNAVPFAQPAEALEITPGLVVTQHSGAGKANQYFLRGFALDHGNDLALWLDGMPLNMPSHVHGQGYADANMLIPELLSGIEVRKGPYFADGGAFASAGQINMQYVDSLKGGLLLGSAGAFGWVRTLGARSWDVAGGTLIAALELNHYNGPWLRPDDAKKINGFVRWSRGTQENGASITAMAYSNHWWATDQIPARAVQQGLLSRWGTEDPSDGGNAARYSLSARWSQTGADSASRVEGFIVRNDLNLYNNYTFFLDNPIAGDQAHQYDHRSIFGLNAKHALFYDLLGHPAETRVGLQGRYDLIRNGFGDSVFRQTYDSIQDNYIKEGSIALWTDTTVRWTPWFRTTLGARFDYWNATVKNPQNPWLTPLVFGDDGNFTGFAYTGTFNTGTRAQTMGSPKAGLVLGPFDNTEFFLNFGEGLQSSDARGTVASLNPANGSRFTDSGLILPVPLLVKTRGAEVGVRSKAIIDGLDQTLSLWWQDFDAENLFEGDSGTTVFGRPSRRYGFELTNKYTPTSWALFEGDVSATHARFRGSDLVQAASYQSILTTGVNDPLFPLNVPGNSPGNYLINAPTVVATGTVEIGEATGWFGALKYRYFGPRPLTEDGQIRSIGAGTLNARAGYRFESGWKFQVDAFNITNNRGDAISYGYGSFARSDFLFFPGYPGGSVGIMDRHFKPLDPPSVRVTLSGPLAVLESALLRPF